MSFSGFSEEDLKRIKSNESGPNSVDAQINTANVKKLDKIGVKTKRVTNQYKVPALQKQDSDDSINRLFDKCKLSIKTPTSPREDIINNNNRTEDGDDSKSDASDYSVKENQDSTPNNNNDTEETSSPEEKRRNSNTSGNSRKSSTNITPDIVRCIDNYTEHDLAAHKAKLADLQLKQKLMEEQNKKRKEMLAKAIADRTKQTADEVLKLEKIKKELQVLDGQFSQDVAVLRKKIDHACLSYADAEKHYLRVEKEFLQAKINLQKEKEKKELLTEHLCALITHNETRKAQKLETLMLELASDKNGVVSERKVDDGIVSERKVDDGVVSERRVDDGDVTAMDDEETVIVDGVDERTGKIVEFTES